MAPGGHHPDPLARGDPAVDDADVGDDAAVGVVDRVEDHRPGRGVGVALRRRDAGDDLVEQLLDAVAGLGADPQHVVGVAADDVGDLRGVPVRVRGGQVDLVEDRDDREVLLQRQVQVRQRLRLDALRGVDEQHRALAGLQRPADLVGEVDVAGGVDEVQDDAPSSPTSHGSRTFCALIVMPRSRSMSIRSRYCARMARPSTTPVSCSIRSASVDLPWSMWAMMQKFRICSGGVNVLSANVVTKEIHSGRDASIVPCAPHRLRSPS